MPRKTTGCWTCRARKKKCDDSRPACSSCRLRGISCYGYDEKPKWMDGGLQERQMLSVFKRQCKTAYRTRRTMNTRPSRNGEHMPLLPAPKNRARPAYQTAEQRVLPKPGDVLDDTCARDGPIPASIEPAVNGREHRFSYSERDISLVMYYLDHIFPRLCPFFKYIPTNDGRGWLLNLFLRTKPLCALAVCLSACDKAQLVLGALNEAEQPHVELEMQHLQIVTDLRDHLGRLSSAGSGSRMSAVVEALACIQHLILFELWIPRKGDFSNDWVMHLDAASILLDSVARKVVVTQRDTEIADHFDMDRLSEGEKAAFEFFFTQYTYLFCLAVVSIGVTDASKLSIERTRSIFGNSTLLRNMLGCDDDVLVTLLNIAVLRDWKDHERGAGCLDEEELGRRVNELLSRLEVKKECLIPRINFAQFGKEGEQAMITRCNITAAQVYLQAIRFGFHSDDPAIVLGVQQTLEHLECMRKHSSVNIPSFPYCIAGCLAQGKYYDRVRALSPPNKDGTHPLVMTKWTLEIIEECWQGRETLDGDEEGCDWIEAMKRLGTRMLLG